MEKIKTRNPFDNFERMLTYSLLKDPYSLKSLIITKEQKDKLLKDCKQSLQDSHGTVIIEPFNQNLRLEEKIKKITRIETKKYILLSIEIVDSEELSWKEMYQIKDYFYEDSNFIEIYPKKNNLIDNGNIRHLYHCFDIELPCLTELENETDFILTDLKL